MIVGDILGNPPNTSGEDRTPLANRKDDMNVVITRLIIFNQAMKEKQRHKKSTKFLSRTMSCLVLIGNCKLLFI